MNIFPFYLKEFLLLTTLLWMANGTTFAQCGESIPITCGTPLTGEYCYGNDDNCVITFCPEDEGGVITLRIDTGAVEVTYDNFNIYFGNTATENPDIVLTGTLTGNSITSLEPDSCLTIQIVSDWITSCETGEIDSNIEYTVSCEIPCTPAADFVVSSDEVCLMEVVSFEVVDASEMATYLWDFGDGNTANGASVEHSFSTSGGQLVSLTATVNGCTKTTTQFIKVAPIPEILTKVQGELIGDGILSVCPKDSIMITANVFAGEIWTPIAQVDTSMAIDSVSWGSGGATVAMEIENSFGIIGDSTEIEFCIEMTHEWFTDSEIIVQSPNGTEITLLEYDDWTLGDINLYGIYCFSMDAEETMLEATDSLQGAATLIAGNYLPYENFDDLIGNPIDGTWTFIFNDYFPAIDDGIIYNVSFNLEGIETLVDTLIVDIADVAINGPSEMDWTTIDSTYQYTGEMPEESGMYTYTITVTDDFGCIYEEVFEIEVLPYSNEICPPECPLFATDTVTFEICKDELIELPTGDFIKVDTSLVFPDISIGLMDTNGCDSLVTFEIIAITNDSCLKTSLPNLEQNNVAIYPNPTKEKTALTIHLLENATVSLSIYDITGKRVQTIVEEQKVGSGFQQFLIETNAYTQGIYFAHLKINDEQIVKKIIVE